MTDIHHGLLAQFWTTQDPACGLPPDAYLSDDFWKTECETVFFNTWVFVAFAHEFEKPGDAVPVTVGDKPVVILKNSEGELGAFHNVCSHRCLQLVDKPKNVGKLIRCPYHAWAYDHAGNLKAAPRFGGRGTQMPQGFKLAEHGLRPVRCHVWHDWVFVNLSGDAPPFEDYAAPLIDRLSELDFARVKPIASLDFGEVACNWKLIMENFIEPYHVPVVHSFTTRQPLNEHHTIIDGTCLGSGVDLQSEQGTGDALAVSSRYLTLFPSFIIGRYFPDQLGVYLNTPCGPDRVHQKRMLYATEGQNLSHDEVEALKKLWWEVHKEDHEMCERMQAGRASPVAETGGVLSPAWEDSVRKFQELIAHSVTERNRQTSPETQQ